MHSNLIYLYIRTSSVGAALSFKKSWDNSDFESLSIAALEIVKKDIEKMLHSCSFSEKATPEVKSYLEDLEAFLSASE